MREQPARRGFGLDTVRDPAAARELARAERQVPGLARAPEGPAHDAALDHDAAADAGAEREGHRHARIPSRAHASLGQRRAVGVVVHPCSHLEAFRKLVAERERAPMRQVRRVPNQHPGAGLDHPRTAEPDPGDRTSGALAQLARGLEHDLERRRGALPGARGAAHEVLDRPVRPNQARLEIGSAQVETHCVGFSHLIFPRAAA